MANEPVTRMAYEAGMTHMAAMESAATIAAAVDTTAAMTPSRGERDARCGDRKNQKQRNRQ